MGRVVRASSRTQIQNAMRSLKKKYRVAFKDTSMQLAFDELWKKWDSETAAMIYSDLLSVYDLLNLTATMYYRHVLEELRRELEELDMEIRKSLTHEAF